MLPENRIPTHPGEILLEEFLNPLGLTQVAFAGHISFSEQTAESPLGPIRVNIETDNTELLIGWLAEKT